MLIALLIVGGSFVLTWNEAVLGTKKEVGKSSSESLTADQHGVVSQNDGVKHEGVISKNSRSFCDLVNVVIPSSAGKSVSGNSEGAVLFSRGVPEATPKAPSNTTGSNSSTVVQAVNTGLPSLAIIPPQHVAPGVFVANIPAAFGDQSSMGDLSESQKEKISQIANDFTTAVQSSQAAPDSPEYKQAWDTAAYRADEAFRGQFGIPAFNAMQMARVYHP